LVRPGNRLCARTSPSGFDVSGAGDTVVAVLALSLARPAARDCRGNWQTSPAVSWSARLHCAVEKHELLAALSLDIALHARIACSARRVVKRAALWKATRALSYQRAVSTCFHRHIRSSNRRAMRRSSRRSHQQATPRGWSRAESSHRGLSDRRVCAALAAAMLSLVFDEPPVEPILAVSVPYFRLRSYLSSIYYFFFFLFLSYKF